MHSNFKNDHFYVHIRIDINSSRYIHDEMYGVALDASGNYVLIGGSGDEYSYSETDPNTNWSSDIWVSYLVVVDPATVRFF